MKCINATLARFYGDNMSIKAQDDIDEALDNLVMATNPEKDILTQLTSTIKHLSETNKILTEQINTLTAEWSQPCKI